jgi:hypothetical protein
VLHLQNGAILSAAYTRVKPSLPGPAVLRGLLMGLIEHVATWPLVALVGRYHPARKELPKLVGNQRAMGQAKIRRAVFGIVLGPLEDAVTPQRIAHAVGPPTAAEGPYVIIGMINSATMLATLIIGLIAGPAVSL